MPPLPSFVIAELCVSRSLPAHSTPALQQTGAKLPTYPFLALQVLGCNLRFADRNGEERVDEWFKETIADYPFMFPVLPYKPGPGFEDCYLHINPTTSGEIPSERILTVHPPLLHPDGCKLYVHTYLGLLARPPSRHGNPFPPPEALSHHYLSEASLENLAAAVFVDDYRWSTVTHTYLRWSGGSELVEPTWSTFSITVPERKGGERWGCVYKYMPFNELDWAQLDTVPLNIYRQLALFELYVLCPK
jgi:hypothetical protein